MKKIFQKTIRVPNETALRTLKVLEEENCEIIDNIPLFGYSTIQCIMNEDDNDRIMARIAEIHK